MGGSPTAAGKRARARRTTFAKELRIVVVGSGMAGLTSARRLVEAGHAVTVLDKGRRPGGRLATRRLTGGALADHGAQFFTARSEAFKARVDRLLVDGTIREWCRGFGGADGHPRYVGVGGMAALAERLAAGLDVRQSVHVDHVRPRGIGWAVGWSSGHGRPCGSIAADAVIRSAPVPESERLLAGQASAPDLTYKPTVCLLAALDRPPAIRAPGGVQLEGHPTWSWVGDNVAKGTSGLPAVTFHTRPDVAAEHFADQPALLTADLLDAAGPWLGRAEILDAVLHRWLYAIPVAPHRQRCVAIGGGRILLSGDAFGGPRVEGAFLSGLAAAEAVIVEAG